MKSTKGFTLIEITLVTALLGILISLTWPAFRSAYRAYLIETTAEELKNCISFARTSAVLDQCRYELVFEDRPPFLAYQLYREETIEGRAEWVSSRGRWSRKRAIPGEIQLHTNSGEIFFYPNGTSTSGEIVLKDSFNGEITTEIVGCLGYARIKERAEK